VLINLFTRAAALGALAGLLAAVMRG